MAIRIPWDKYESAVLLDACLRVERGVISRSSAITYVSNTLRKRAISKGLEIDDIFRNENGISMQFSAMANCLHHKSAGLTISKLFRETVELYESNEGAFNKLVQGAMELNLESAKEDAFASWLKEQDEYAPSAEKIISSLNLISILCLKAVAIKEPIAKMDSEKKVNHVLNILYGNKTPHIHSKKRLLEYIYAVKAFLKYLTESESSDKSTSIETSQNETTAGLRVDFVNPAGFAYTRPDYYQFAGSDAVPIKNWTKLYVSIVNELCSRDPRLLESLVGKNISGAARMDLLYADESHRMTAPYNLENGLVIETNLSASDIVKKIRILLDLYVIPYDSLAIIYHKRGKNETTASSRAEGSSTSIWVPQYTSQITQILKGHYAYGFRIDSPIEIMRFRNYAENNAISIPDSDEELDKEISAAGILIDGKIFAFEDSVLSELSELVNGVFDGGVGVIFLDPFFVRNAEWLEEHYISSTEMVKALLSRKCPDFYYGQNIITAGEKKSEHESIVSEIHRISGAQDVIWFADICELLPYIPSDKIAWSLSTSNDFVRISEGKYFVMEHFVIDDDEIATIQDFVASECSGKGYVSIADLPFGSIPERNYELSTTALYSAVFIAVLKQQYRLNGKILTRGENGIDIVVLLKKYCQEHEFCTVTEVMGRAVELVGAQNRQNSFVALYDTMIRVDRDHFVSDAQVQFDVDQIDCVLQNIIGNRFAPIKSVTTFALFPPCGQSWNHYLLESFCYRFSKKYQLCVSSYNDKNAGIIAAKTTSMSYTDMLCEAASKADVPLTLETIGQYFFENGLSTRRKFSSLPEIIDKVTMLRGEV